MQNAKDTFYELLRGRLVALNPERTIVLRGVVRPGMLVEENELLSATTLPDCFRLQWTVSRVDANGSLPVAALQCTIEYETAGTAGNGGMDRGRFLSAMDEELQAAVNAAPRMTPKMNYAAIANGGTPATMTTNIWWSDLTVGKTVINDDRLARTASVTVMSYQEAGEL